MAELTPCRRCIDLPDVVHCERVTPIQELSRPVACVLVTIHRYSAGILAGLNSLIRPWTRNSLLCAALLAMLVTATAQPATTLISLTNSTWRYDDAGLDRGTAWRAVSYPAESTWRTGRGLFGLEGSLPFPYPEPIATPLVVSSTRSAYYFRTHFNFIGSTAGLNLIARAYIDDGAVVYINGAEAARVRMPDGAIAFGTRATTVAPEGVVTNLALPTTNLVQGDNVIAVEVHQRSASDADVVFGLSLESASSQLPVFTTPEEPADRAVDQDAATTLISPATGFPAPTFQWFKSSVALPGATSDSLAIPFMTAAEAGSYYCVAANSAGSVTSRTAVVTYVPDTNGVRILYALGLADFSKIRVVFSEPPNPQSAIDGFEWMLYSEDRSIVVQMAGDGQVISPVEIELTTEFPRDPNVVYILQRGVQLEEMVNHGNPLPSGTEVPIAAFEANLILMDDIHPWKYNQSGIDLGTAWRAADFNDSGWPGGLSPFDGFRQPSGPSCRDHIPIIPEDGVRTCITLSNAANTAQIPTVYFRTKFNFEGDAARSLLRLDTFVNDGAVYYLNGVELVRSSMPAGDIGYSSLSTRSIGDAVSESYILYAPSLVAGENTLAVELHQGTLQSESMTLGLELHGILPTKTINRPKMIIRHQGADTIEVIWSPAGGVLECTDDLAADWAPVQENYGSDRLTTSRSAARKFYRVVMP